MIKKEIKVVKSARYFVLGNESTTINKVWIVFHGYGQLADYFIKNFEAINNGETLIIAPEGLNRFYWKGFSNKVVAAWMTKEDRESDINDYVNYLNKMWDEIKNDFGLIDVPVTLFAYSQGAATLCRWYMLSEIKPVQMIFWAGTLAHDIDYDKLKQKLIGVKTTQLFGDKDEFYKPEQIEKLKAFIEKKKLDITFKTYDGGHEIKSELLKKYH